MPGTGKDPIDTKREEFRKYLEREGILESLTKSLVALYEEPEKPADALAYMKNNFAGQDELHLELTTVREENRVLKERIEALEREKMDLEKKLDAAGTGSAEAPSAADAPAADAGTTEPAADTGGTTEPAAAAGTTENMETEEK